MKTHQFMTLTLPKEIYSEIGHNPNDKLNHTEKEKIKSKEESLTIERLKNVIKDFKELNNRLNDTLDLDKENLYQSIVKEILNLNMNDSQLEKNHHPGSVNNTENNNGIISVNQEVYSPLLRKIIHGDFFENREIEVQLQQRNNKKVKYKRNTYSEIHRFDEELEKQLYDFIENQLNNKDNFKMLVRKEEVVALSKAPVKGIDLDNAYTSICHDKQMKCHKKLMDLRRIYENI